MYGLLLFLMCLWLKHLGLEGGVEQGTVNYVLLQVADDFFVPGDFVSCLGLLSRG